MESEKSKYIFNNREFIGYIKFYDSERKFGYIVSNNFGMNHNRKFCYKFPNFYIDYDSFEENVKGNRLIVFRPQIINDNIKAGNIRQYNPYIHKDIAIRYILHNNNIHIVEKSRYSTVQYDINIYALSGVHKYELIQECCELYKRNGAEALLHALHNYFSSIQGVCIGSVSTWDVWHKGRYNFEESMEYDRKEKEKEEDAFKRLFELVDKITAKKIVLKHATLQYYAPYDVLLPLAGKLNDDFRIPKEVREVHYLKKLQCIIEENKVFQCFYDEEKKRDKKPTVYHRRNLILLMLKECPEGIKDSLYKEVLLQIKEGIEKFIADIEHKTRTEKTELLRYFADYIDDRQKAIINESVAINDYLERLNSNLRLTFSYYFLDFNLNSITKQFYEQREFVRNEAKPILVDAILQKIDIKLNKAYAKDYNEIIDIVNSNRFILEECQEQALSIIKNKFRAFCEKEIVSRYYSDKLPIIIKKLFAQEEINKLLNLYSEKVLSLHSLDVIHRFYKTFGLTCPMTNRELVKSRSLAGLLDCGDFFSSMEDRGCSLLNDIFEKIWDNRNTHGVFLEGFDLYSDRCEFLTQLINKIIDWTILKEYILTLSYHDRIILTLSMKKRCFSRDVSYIEDRYDNTFLTIDDVKKELEDIGVEGDCDDILQLLPQSSIAIINIILSSKCYLETDAQTVLLWLRKYYSINDRRYLNVEERNNYEAKLLAYLIDISHKFNIELLQYGIDVDNQLIPLSYGDLTHYQPFLCKLIDAIVKEQDSKLMVFLPKEIVNIDGIDSIIERVFCTNLELRDKELCLIVDKTSNIFNSKTIIAYIALNILNNLHLIFAENRKTSPIIPFDNQEMLSYITSIFSMKYNVGWTTVERFKWDGSEDSDVSWEHIIIEFEKNIDETIKKILLNIEPKLRETSPGILEYHDGPDWGTDFSNKEIISKMTLQLFKAFKEGLL